MGDVWWIAAFVALVVDGQRLCLLLQKLEVELIEGEKY